MKSWQELTVDVTSPNKSNIYLCAVMNHETIKCTAPNSNTRTTQNKTHAYQKCDSLPVWHNYTKFPHHKKCRYGSMMLNQKRSHYSGHIPMSAVNALITDQLSHLKLNWVYWPPPVGPLINWVFPNKVYTQSFEFEFKLKIIE